MRTDSAYKPLKAQRVHQIRSEAEQLPEAKDGRRALEAIHKHFSADPFAFEQFAADLVRRMDPNVVEIDVTRRHRDGGRDATGLYRIGTGETSIRVEFALEAKCYKPGANSVGVRETSRLISRLRHRQFGILATTSTVNPQAYREIVEDEHPVLILAGRDITEILGDEARGAQAVKEFLLREYPITS
jgi:hypothetical protein